jgi:hypothetical protein
MHLIPYDPEETTDKTDDVTLTGIEVSGGDREQILEALRLNRQMLHAPQPHATVDEAAMRNTINDLLDQLNEAE